MNGLTEGRPRRVVFKLLGTGKQLIATLGAHVHSWVGDPVIFILKRYHKEYRLGFSIRIGTQDTNIIIS